MSDQSSRTLEENFTALEEIMDKLSADISLEEAFSAYAEGMEIVKQCNEQIDMVEKKVLVLTGDGEQEFH